LKIFKGSTRASVLVIYAILLPLFILLIGMVVDIGRSLVYKEELNKACMAAAEEASKDIDMSVAQNSGKNILNDSYRNIIYDFFENNYEPKNNCDIDYLNYEVIGGLENPKFIKVSCEAKIKCFFLKIVGINYILVHSEANGRLRQIK
jgi:hypothetical protein